MERAFRPSPDTAQVRSSKSFDRPYVSHVWPCVEYTASV